MLAYYAQKVGGLDDWPPCPIGSSANDVNERLTERLNRPLNAKRCI